ncbi:MAG: DUF4349 domain-containing protein [Candidatus Kerfeldbacteria bacterium]|nr:DUF4349 domain-containing protein [Candidatus Kerfeldbacteria bacterium]
MEQAQSTKKKSWAVLGYTIGGLGLAGLALITAYATSNRSMPKEKALGDSLALGSPEVSGLSSNGIQVEELDFFDRDEPRYNDEVDQEYTYQDDGQSKSVFSESIELALDVKNDTLDIINSVREEVTRLGGYIVNISYYDTSGTIDIQLPNDQLQSFEDTLKTLDANNEVEVTQYTVANVSSEVVAMDEYLDFAQQQVTKLENVIASPQSTDAARSAAQEQLVTTRQIIEDSKQARDETIAQYNLVNVTVHIAQYVSFWEGNYYQYDRSTFAGMVKYEFGRAIYSLIRSTGKITVFFIWLAVYSVIFVPVFFIARASIRKIRQAMRQRQS